MHAAGSRAYLVLAVPLKRMGLLGNLYELGFTLGAALGNAAVGIIAARSGFQLAGMIIVGLGVVTAVAAQIWLPPVKPKVVSPEPITLGSYWQMVRRRSVQLLLLLRALPTIYWSTGQLVIGIQLLRLTDSPVAPALFYAISLLAIGTTMMPVGWAADRWGSGYPVLASTVLVIAGSVLAAIFIGNAWGLAAGAFVGHLGAWWLSGLFRCWWRKAARTTNKAAWPQSRKWRGAWARWWAAWGPAYCSPSISVARSSWRRG